MRTMQRRQQQLYDEAVPERTGLPSLLLMEHAALALRQACIRVLEACRGERPAAADSAGGLSPAGRRAVASGPVTILVGKGNNGGDGYALARLLAAAGYPVRLWSCLRSETGGKPAEGQADDLHLNRRATAALGIPCEAVSPPGAEDLTGLFVDCVLGTGFHRGRPLPPAWRELFERLELARGQGLAYVIAADIPSGVEADTGLVAEGALRADETVTFVYPKPGLYTYPGRALAGRVTCADLGLPEAFADQLYGEMAERGPVVVTAADVRRLLPGRRAEGYKQAFGHCLIYAGSAAYIGAGILATEAALASGAGLVTRMVEPALRVAAATALPSAITAAKPSDLAELEADFRARANRYQSVLVGPGSGLTEETARLVHLAAEGSPLPVFDADALTLIAQKNDLKMSVAARLKRGLSPAILTPHPGEFARLFPELDPAELGRIEAARLGAEQLQCVLVLKGAGTVVAFPGAGLEGAESALPEGGIFINTTGSSALAKGGSGDVLAGLLAGLAARGLDPVAAAVCGVYWHGLAGDLEAAVSGPESLVPDRLAKRLGEAYRRLQAGDVLA